MPTVEKMVYVDVDLDDFGDDELLDELESRKADISSLGIPNPDHLQAQRQAMLRALWNRDEAQAVELLKTYLCDCLGRATI